MPRGPSASRSIATSPYRTLPILSPLRGPRHLSYHARPFAGLMVVADGGVLWLDLLIGPLLPFVLLKLLPLPLQP